MINPVLLGEEGRGARAFTGSAPVLVSLPKLAREARMPVGGHVQAAEGGTGLSTAATVIGEAAPQHLLTVNKTDLPNCCRTISQPRRL